VLKENKAMQAVITKSDFIVTSRPSGNTFSFLIKFS